VYNTWPLIDGALIPEPSRLLFEQPAWRNFFENALTVQFQHRMVAYLLLLCVVLHAFDAARLRERVAFSSALALAASVTIQVVLGVTTLLYQAPLALALLHQAMAMMVFTVAIVHAERLVPMAAAGQVKLVGARI
jgi:cytochrome c oxidase assembly protein subunit 15